MVPERLCLQRVFLILACLLSVSKSQEEAGEDPRRLTSNSSDDDILPYRWFQGWFSDCTGPCGGALQREREVYCMVQCSLWRCEEVSDFWCLELGLSRPVSVEVCEETGAPCTSATQTQAASPTMSSAVSVTQTQATQAPTTSIIDNSGDWECVVDAEEVTSSQCEDAAGRCYDSCPCCRRKLTGTTGVDDTAAAAADDGPDFMIFIFIGAGAAGCFILLCLFWVLWGVLMDSPSSKAPAELKSPKSSSDKTSSTVKDAKQAWKEAEAFHAFTKPTSGQPLFEDDLFSTAGSWRAATATSPSASATSSTWRPSGPTAVGSSRAGSARQHPFAAANTTPRQAPPPPPTEERPRAHDAGSPTQQQHSAPRKEPVSSAESSPAGSYKADDASPPSASASRRKHAAAAAFAEAEKAAHSSPGGREKAGGSGSSKTPKGTAMPPRGTSDWRDGASTSRSRRPQSPTTRSPEDVPKRVGTPTAEDLIAKVDKELDTTRGKDLDFRRRHFKTLLLRWHPDKNPSQNATEVFRHLMKQRGGYLEA